MEWWEALNEVRVKRRQVLKAAAGGAAIAAVPAARFASVLAQARVMTLDYFTLFYSGDAAAMERIVRAFSEAHTTVKLNLLQGQWAEYYAQLFAAVGAGNAPPGAPRLTHVGHVVQQRPVPPRGAGSREAAGDARGIRARGRRRQDQ